MEPGLTVELRIDKLVAGGDGLARADDGRIVFVPGVLPGELVRVELVQRRKDFARARLVEVLEPSADRRVPPCPFVARGCGGCDWQHVAAGAQLAHKVGIVVDALARTARLPDARVVAGATVAEIGYRTTLRMAVGREERLGFRARGSHRVVPVSPCLVADDALNEIIAELARVRGIEVTLRVGDDGASVDPPQGGRAASPVTITVAGVPLRVSPGAFFQSGPQAAELLVEWVGELAGVRWREGPMIDAYGGVGLFAAALGVSGSVVIEENPAAVDDARHNLRGRDIDVIGARVEDWQPDGAPRRWMVADPARRGLEAAGVEAVARSGIERLVLVSCDPVSMARDTALLVRHGFVHDRSVVLDLFPNTHHVEVVSRFDRVG